MPFDAELRHLLDAYLAAYAARDADGCAVLHAENAEIHSPFGPPARGRRAIRDAHIGWFEEEESDKRLDILSAAADGALAYALLRYAADTPGGPEAGTSLNVLQRCGDGTWEMLLTSLNPDSIGVA